MFRIYENPINLLVETTEILVKATCALHNWLRQSSKYKAPYRCISVGLVDVELWDEGRILPGLWRENESPCNKTNYEQIMNMNHNDSRKKKLNPKLINGYFLTYFLTYLLTY